jgi:hypothetical protein
MSKQTLKFDENGKALTPSIIRQEKNATATDAEIVKDKIANGELKVTKPIKRKTSWRSPKKETETNAKTDAKKLPTGKIPYEPEKPAQTEQTKQANADAKTEPKTEEPKTEQPKAEQPKHEKTTKLSRARLSDADVLAFMEQGKTYTSTEIRDHFKADSRGVVRAVMRRLEKQKQVEIVQDGKNKQYGYRKLPSA